MLLSRAKLFLIYLVFRGKKMEEGSKVTVFSKLKKKKMLKVAI